MCRVSCVICWEVHKLPIKVSSNVTVSSVSDFVMLLAVLGWVRCQEFRVG